MYVQPRIWSPLSATSCMSRLLSYPKKRQVSISSTLDHPGPPWNPAWEQDVGAEGCDLYVRLTLDNCFQPWSKGVQNFFGPKLVCNYLVGETPDLSYHFPKSHISLNKHQTPCTNSSTRRFSGYLWVHCFLTGLDVDGILGLKSSRLSPADLEPPRISGSRIPARIKTCQHRQTCEMYRRI